jgi:hypothetical protein
MIDHMYTLTATTTTTTTSTTNTTAAATTTATAATTTATATMRTVVQLASVRERLAQAESERDTQSRVAYERATDYQAQLR